MHALRFLLAALCSNFLPAAVQAADADALVFESAWIRAAPPSAPVMAAYVRIANRGRAAVVIEKASSEAFGAVQVHEMRDVDGVMRMRSLSELRLAPGESIVLAPGGMHLMLMRPVRMLAVGEQATIDFELGDGSRERVAFDVRGEAPR